MSKVIKTVGRFVTGGVLGLAMGGKKKTVAQPGPVSRDDAAMEAERNDALRKRRGGAADMLTGTGGAEAGGGAKFIAGN
ncbi:hypothetical protein [Croceicoccus mobilis]|uniref:Uncharacterized protein n=1 Tax=Croceicoccus mobilis TaxID=1703339 RepID=A0A916Z3A3_9SPHN|nr:hypothetical protein [Croceicoccus mobilis]GGD73975.1 hypothetical protein GCM10010990_24490 [Croceicoccus mobilis]